MQQPSAHSNVGKVSNPSDKHRLSISLIPFWHSGVSASVRSPVDLVYARRSMIHQNPESTGATLPMALSPKSACRVSTPFLESWSTLKLAGMAPSPSLNRSTFFSQPCSRSVLSRKCLTISGSPFIRNASALGTKSLTNT
ncbi:Os02g0550650, partial [Oryza sativa Japonica Group]